MGADEQRAVADKLRDQEADPRRPGLPVHGVARQARRGGLLRPERRVGGEEEPRRRQDDGPGLRARAAARGPGRAEEGEGAREGGVRQEEEGGIESGSSTTPGEGDTPLFGIRLSTPAATSISDR